MPLTAATHRLSPSSLGPFRFKRLGANYLLTLETGQHTIIPSSDFVRLATGSMHNFQSSNPRLYRRLLSQGFISGDKNAPQELCERYRQKKSYLARATSLHIVVVTLRCDHQCRYCQSNAGSMRDRSLDMSMLTARKVVDRIFESPSKNLTIEFQGGEPLVNLPVVEYIIRRAKKINQSAKRQLSFVMVTNLSFMTRKRLEFLVKEGVGLCTSLDGPKNLHDGYRIRPSVAAGSHAQVVRWMNEAQHLAVKNPVGYRINALMTTTRDALKYPREIVDEYRRLGLSYIFLRPMSTFATPASFPREECYTPDEFLGFYKQAMDYIIHLNLKGEFFAERKTQIFLAKIFNKGDPNFMDLRSPCGAVIGQIAYNHNGDVYTCDEGRMLGRCRDNSFRIGNVFKNSYQDMMKHDSVSTLCVASCLENLPGCHECAYAPYCGVCPLVNYKRYGSLFRPYKYSEECYLHEKMLDFIFLWCQNKKIKEVFLSWLKR